MDRQSTTMLRDFVCSLSADGDIRAALRAGLIGEGVEIAGPYGPKPLVYADYAASGRALVQVERFVHERVLPFYSNSHTEASYCGAFMNRLRSEARTEIARICSADEAYAVIFTGSGATSGLNRLVHLLLGTPQGSAPQQRALVLLGPYEHHSNILPWRESGAEVMELPEGEAGGVDLAALETTLRAASREGRRTLGAFSAASNVTGIVADVEATTALLKRYGALAVWDYAGGGPYLPIDLRAGAAKDADAVVLSPHKFIGGPGASGLLIVRKAAVVCARPSLPGGGTVTFVSPWLHRYASDLSAREEAGTPNVLGDIRAALALMIKREVGCDFIRARNDDLRDRALGVWRGVQQLELLGACGAWRLPIFSFRVKDGNGGYIHHQLITRMLSDHYGVQARGGCACAGPYAHRLLNLSRDRSDAVLAAIEAGDELEKPGWTRLNFSYLMDDAKVDYVTQAVLSIARDAAALSEAYAPVAATARFYHARERAPRSDAPFKGE